MSILPDNYVIAIERTLRRISFVDVNTLTVAHQINIDSDIIDVAITTDFNKAIITAFNTKQLFEINLRANPPSVVNTVDLPTPLEDLDLTADNRFALSVGGVSAVPQNMVSYSLVNSSAKFIPADAQAVAISPNLNGRLLTARALEGRVRLYLINNEGNLTDTGSEAEVNDTPINLAYTPDGQFSFVANLFGNEIVVLATGNPNYFGETSRMHVTGSPQTIVVSKNGKKVYVLTSQEVAIFELDPVAQRLIPAQSFTHHLNIINYFGVDQMTLDFTETRLFISSQGQLAAFDLIGTLLGIVQNVQSDGGVAAGQTSHFLPINALLVKTYSRLLFLDETLKDIIQDVLLGGSGHDNVVISRDCSRAIIPTSVESQLIDIDLTTNPPSLKHTAQTPVPLLSMDITPDNQFTVGVPYNENGKMVSYSFFDHAIKSIPTDAQAVVVSPNGNGIILASRYYQSRVRRYLIDREGNLTDTNSEVMVGDSPINLTYSPDSNFAFIACWGSREVVVLDTSNPFYFGETSRVRVNGRPQTILVSRDGSKVYVLTTQEVQIFNFDPVDKKLTLSSSFSHNLTVIFIYGVREMALNSDETKLFIMTSAGLGIAGLTAFTTTGEKLGSTNLLTPGIAICKPM